jgi:hypothetical protein
VERLRSMMANMAIDPRTVTLPLLIAASLLMDTASSIHYRFGIA